MSKIDRRKFLKMTIGAAAAAGLAPESIRKALAVPASSPTGTIEDVQHIVIFMQENRSFDHYFGHMRGVRGYNDRFPVTLPNNLPVWFQPRHGAPSQTVAPFHINTLISNAQCVGDLDHSWSKTHAAINGGRYDQWPANKTDMTMAYHLRTDIPFQYALADAFTVCDQYFCSLSGPTHPNRMYLMSGMIDPTGAGGGPLLDNNDVVVTPALPPFDWTTYPERLEKAGISWQVYQQGLDMRDNYNGNYGTNVLACFRNFIDAPPGSPLQKRGMSVRMLEDFARDVKNDALPQVSWLLPPAAFSEHPSWTPAYGAEYTSRILDALTANPTVWSKTAMFIMYDENDGFFDHIVPPQPPTVPGSGKSTVGIGDETHDVVNPRHKPLYTADKLPYGLGPRVPMTVVSPWSKGGYVCSQVFDHTSVIRFIESRFGVHEPNISAWRRTVCGDLSSAFNFADPDGGVPRLPNTSGYIAMADLQCKTFPNPTIPDAAAPPSIGAQETGIRPARPLPYQLHANCRIDPAAQRFAIDFVNAGAQGAHFWVYAADDKDGPRSYTVGAGEKLSDAWQLGIRSERYGFTVHGVNGFFRRFNGSRPTAGLPVPDVVDRYDTDKGEIHLMLINNGGTPVDYTVHDMAYGQAVRTYRVPAASRVEERWELSGSNHWYDLQVTIGSDPFFLRRLAGHVETGKTSSSDPAAMAPVLTAV